MTLRILWNDELDCALRRLYGESRTVADISKKMGISVPVIRKRANVLGLKLSPSSNFRNPNTQEILYLRTQKKTFKEIAEKLGTSRSAVAGIIYRAARRC